LVFRFWFYNPKLFTLNLFFGRFLSGRAFHYIFFALFSIQIFRSSKFTRTDSQKGCHFNR